MKISFKCYPYNHQKGSLFQRIMSMGQLLPAVDYPSKSHIDRKNSEVFRNFVLDKIYAIEESKAKEQSKSKSKDENTFDSLNVSKTDEPFTITGTRIKDPNNLVENRSRTRIQTEQFRSRIKSKYDYYILLYKPYS